MFCVRFKLVFIYNTSKFWRDIRGKLHLYLLMCGISQPVQYLLPLGMCCYCYLGLIVYWLFIINRGIMFTFRTNIYSVATAFSCAMLASNVGKVAFWLLSSILLTGSYLLPLCAYYLQYIQTQVLGFDSRLLNSCSFNWNIFSRLYLPCFSELRIVLGLQLVHLHCQWSSLWMDILNLNEQKLCFAFFLLK